ncbi:acetyl-CoA carboxylase biotin carboxyl carrier protein [Geodermatophilus sp. SYSU D00815]
MTTAESAPGWDDVLELVRRLEDSGYADVELEMPGVSLRVSRSVLPPRTGAPAAAPAPVPTAAAAPAPAAPPPAPPPPAEEHLVEIPAPVLGVFYRRPSPDAPPFVDVGGEVEPHTTVAIVEVMKLMNQVPAGVRGRVVRVCAEEGQLVEHGQPLFLVDPRTAP